MYFKQLNESPLHFNATIIKLPRITLTSKASV